MKKAMETAIWFGKLIIGAAIFSLGFDLFLEPNGLNAGGLTGLAMVLVYFMGFGSVGTITTLVNLPLFILGGKKIGKKFFFGSLVGMLALTLTIDLFTIIPVPETDPLLAALYGGVICGAGLGIVFMAGTSTGGSDILVRLLKLKYRNVPIGQISLCFDALVVALTGLVFHDVSKSLYTGITVFLCSQVIDAMVYRFDYSKVALIITSEHQQIADAIGKKLDRGATLLHGEGSYTHREMKIVLAAVKKQQIAELKELVMEIDPNAFVILQEAHQVLGDGFSRYSKDSL